MAPRLRNSPSLTTSAPFSVRLRESTGKSKKTMYRRKKARLELASKGFLGIHEFLATRKTLHSRAAADHMACESEAGSLLNSDSGVSVQAEEEESSGESELELGSNQAGSSVRRSRMSELLPPDVDSESKGDFGPAVCPGIAALLENLRNQREPHDPSPSTSSDSALDLINNHELLRSACAKLSVKSKDKKLDVFLRARVTVVEQGVVWRLKARQRSTQRTVSMEDLQRSQDY